MKKEDNWTIYVVPHTHWDKEWYFTKQDSDILLAQNFHNIKQVFRKNPLFSSFTYDGQTSVVDDYLQYVGEDRELFEILKAKKLIIGPWYTQPDFFNTTSESLVRNLLIGINKATRYAGNYLKVAYVPDSFGHNAQMPQIYQQFGLKDFIYWRGLRKQELEVHGTFTNWTGIDGSQVRAYNFLNGYWALGALFPYLNLEAASLKTQAQTFLSQASALVAELKRVTKNTHRNLLIPLGGDQAPISELTPQFFAQVNDLASDNWILGSYEDFFAAVNKTEPELGTLTGELKSPAFARIHKTIGSQRYDVKQLMKTTENNLYDVLEPLATYWFLATGHYPQAVIDQVLRNILLSQAHDSLGGCNSDATNADVQIRLRQANELVLSEITKIQREISTALGLKGNDILLFNPQPRQLKKHVELTVFTKKSQFQIYDTHQNLIDFITLQQKFYDGGKKVLGVNENHQEIVVADTGFYETKILVVQAVFPPFSTVVWHLVENAPTTPVVRAKKLAITPNSDGTIDIYNTVTHQLYKNQFTIYADVDAGDSYDYSPLNDANVPISQLTSSTAEIINLANGFQKIVLTNDYQVPTTLSATNPVHQRFVVEYLVDDSTQLKVSIKTRNQTTAIRWRIRFNPDIVTDYVVANQAYHLLQRPTVLTADLAVWKSENWPEKPVAIETMESFVYLENPDHKVGVITNGLNEYEVVDNCQVHLTLYRSVPLLGRNNLLWRPGRASGTSEFPIHTPAASLLNTDLEFTFTWFDEPPTSNIWTLAQVTNLLVPYYQKQDLNKLAKRFDRFIFQSLPQTNPLPNQLLKVDNPDFVVKTLKLGVDGQSVILRGFNATPTPIAVVFTNAQNEPFPVDKTNLRETVIIPKKTNYELKPWEIATFSYQNKEFKK